MQRPGQPIPFLFQQAAPDISPAAAAPAMADSRQAAQAVQASTSLPALTAAAAQAIVEELVAGVVGPGVSLPPIATLLVQDATLSFMPS